MQAIIMAAGFGSRIAKISNNNPKSFLEINDEKLIERAVRLLEDRKITDITVVTGYKSEEFHQLLGEKVKYKHNPLYFCTNVLGSFACGMDNLKEDFIFIHADTIFDETILDDIIASDISDIVLPVDYKSCVEEEMKVTTIDGCIDVIHKSIALDIAEGEFIGVAKIKKSVIEGLKLAVYEELKTKSNHQEYFEEAIQNLINKGLEVRTVPTAGRPWIEIDFPEDYATAKGLFE
ncbi:NTP transferase domain-containing protein [Vibrio breoganii]